MPAERSRSRAGRKPRNAAAPPALLLTCEHGGNRIPRNAKAWFADACEVLESHRGWDPGALELARAMSRSLSAPLVFSQTSRLLVELNRTLGHPRIFSEFTRNLPADTREALLREHYLPYRQQVETQIATATKQGPVLHVSVHTFTPGWKGKVRRTDVGLLFDPQRPAELDFCDRWRRELRRLHPEFAVHLNLPYRGTSDGFTTALRRVYPDSRYRGIEIEVNQKFPLVGGPQWRELQQVVCRSLQAALTPPAGQSGHTPSAHG